MMLVLINSNYNTFPNWQFFLNFHYKNLAYFKHVLSQSSFRFYHKNT